MTLSVALVEWKPSWRIIPSLFPPIQLQSGSALPSLKADGPPSLTLIVTEVSY